LDEDFYPVKVDQFYTFVALLISSTILAVKAHVVFFFMVIITLLFLMMMTAWEMSMLEADKESERKKRS
jgi:hypothetical protein